MTDAYQNRSQRFLRAPAISTLDLGVGVHRISATRAWSGTENNGFTLPHAQEEAFMLSLQLVDYSGDILLNDRKLSFRQQRANELQLYDYRLPWSANLRSAYDCVNFHVPLEALNSALQASERRRVQTLRYQAGEPMADPVFAALVRAILPSLLRPEEANLLFLSHVSLALATHVADRYAEFALPRPAARSRLAPWQERRAKEMIDANIAGGLSQQALADACGLSAGYFARAFRETVGMPPHKWLLVRRVEHAKHLLHRPDMGLAEIASACGFADQSHFTRVFCRLEGATPGVWRRQRRYG